MATYFVIGASRGIGLELVNQILQGTNAANKVIAGLYFMSFPFIHLYFYFVNTFSLYLPEIK